jgi:DNA-binding NarL/FixJ family response regulator
VPSTSVLVLSSHPVLQGVVRLAAEATEGIERTVLCDDAADAAAHLVKEPTCIVVIELDGGSVDPVRQVRAAGADARIIVLSNRIDGRQVLDAMRLGADAFLPNPDGLRNFDETLARVVSGERVFPPALEAEAVLQVGRLARQARDRSDVAPSITPRELEILALLAEGLTTRQIARGLDISPRTVENHVAKLYRKLEVGSRLQAVARAATLGLIELR